ncbi:putative leucine-rich repeat-containing protein DDB_G0290503 [Mytilus edulis]|uniref:putative leucine-rich repeat-containing protein DDB_G0290503 n=1 Tax=Mytilus edulis TaxID=6550 RepID=UPI0039EEB53E
MFSQKYLSILYFNWIIYSCKCQDLEKFVAPILDNQNAPLVAIVDTRNISSHIVRSIEIPLREIINSTTQCKIKEELEKYAVSSQRDVKGQLETLQHKIDKHIEDLRDQFTVVNQDFVSLRKDTEETILHEILEQKKDLIKLVNTLKSDLDKKMNNLSSNVVFLQSEVQKKIDKHIKDNRDQFTTLQQDIATLRKEMEEKISHDNLENIKNCTAIFNTVNNNLDEKVKNLTNNVEIMQSELAEQLEQHSNRLGGHGSRLDDLNASLHAKNARAQQQQKSDLLETQLANAEEINNTKLQENVNLKNLTELGFYEYAAIFTEPHSYSATTPVLYIHGHDDGNVTIKYNSFNRNMSITKGKNEMILKKEVFLKDGIENKGIHITSTVPITIYVFQTYSGSSDGYAAIPIKYMSGEYIVSSFTVWQHNNHEYNSFIGIVSLSEYTNVKVKLKMKQGTVKFNGKEFGNGKIIEINISAFQTLQLSHNYDLSGSIISSSKPVGVVAGNICNKVNNNFCSHSTEK